MAKLKANGVETARMTFERLQPYGLDVLHFSVGKRVLYRMVTVIDEPYGAARTETRWKVWKPTGSFEATAEGARGFAEFVGYRERRS